MDKATEKLVAKEESGTVDLSESETWSFHEEEVTEKPVAYKTVTGIPRTSSKSENSGNPKAERMATQSTHFSSHSASHGCSLLDRKKDLRTRACGPNGGPGREGGFLGHIPENTTLQAAVHLSQDYEGEFTIRQEVSLEFCGTGNQ